MSGKEIAGRAKENGDSSKASCRSPNSQTSPAFLPNSTSTVFGVPSQFQGKEEGGGGFYVCVD